MSAAVEHSVSWNDARWKQAGVTYRKLDHWTTRGYMRTVYEQNPGTGTARLWPASEIRIAARMVELTMLGFTVPAAARMARDEGERKSIARRLLLMGEAP